MAQYQTHKRTSHGKLQTIERKNAREIKYRGPFTSSTS